MYSTLVECMYDIYVYIRDEDLTTKSYGAMGAMLFAHRHLVGVIMDDDRSAVASAMVAYSAP